VQTSGLVDQRVVLSKRLRTMERIFPLVGEIWRIIATGTGDADVACAAPCFRN